MTVDDRHPASTTSRRGLIKLLGLAGLGTLVASHARSQARAAGPASSGTAVAGPVTRIEGFDGAELSAITGPVRLPGLAAGARLAACLVVPGTPGGIGAQQLVRGVEALSVTSPGGGAMTALAAMQADPAAEHAAQRLFAALSGPDALDVFGFSAEVGESGLSATDAEVRWRGLVRGGAGRGEIQSLLTGYHAILLGTLSAAGTFEDFASYVRVRRVG